MAYRIAPSVMGESANEWDAITKEIMKRKGGSSTGLVGPDPAAFTAQAAANYGRGAAARTNPYQTGGMTNIPFSTAASESMSTLLGDQQTRQIDMAGDAIAKYTDWNNYLDQIKANERQARAQNSGGGLFSSILKIGTKVGGAYLCSQGQAAGCAAAVA